MKFLITLIETHIMAYSDYTYKLHNINSSLILHLKINFYSRFPIDDKRRQMWLGKIHRINWDPPKHARVCSDHFDEKFICRKSKRVTLKIDAVPSRFFVSHEAKDLLFGIRHDHNYSPQPEENSHKYGECSFLSCEQCVVDEVVLSEVDVVVAGKNGQYVEDVDKVTGKFIGQDVFESSGPVNVENDVQDSLQRESQVSDEISHKSVGTSKV